MTGAESVISTRNHKRAADLLQHALTILEHNQTPGTSNAPVLIQQALKAIGFYSQTMPTGKQHDLELLFGQAVLCELKPTALAAAFQDSAAALTGSHAREVAINFAAVCNERYQADIAAAVIRGSVDASLPVWAYFVIQVWLDFESCDLSLELIETQGIDLGLIVSYLHSSTVQSALLPYEQKQLKRLNAEGATVYRGASAKHFDLSAFCSWTLSKTVAAEHAKRCYGRDDGIVYTATIKPGGVLLYLSSRREREIAIDTSKLSSVTSRPPARLI